MLDYRKASALSRNFSSMARELALLVLFFRRFPGTKAAVLTWIEHTTAPQLSLGGGLATAFELA